MIIIYLGYSFDWAGHLRSVDGRIQRFNCESKEWENL